MKTSIITAALALAALALSQAFTSCAGLTGQATTPWGEITTKDGLTVILPYPIVTPSGK